LVVIVCDGSSKGNPGQASIGVVVWDRDNPRRLSPNHRYHGKLGIKTNMEAEWEALLYSVRYAFNFPDNEEVHIFSDSQTVVKQANGLWEIKHKNIVPLFKLFVEAMKGRRNIYINWIPRQLVYLADKEAAKENG